MKECPHCKKTYDDELSFCLNDGKPLAPTNDPEATVVKPPGPFISATLLEKYSRLMERDQRLFVSSMPTDKLTTAYTTYAQAALLANEKPILMYDNSTKRNGRAGLLMTENNLYYKNIWRAGHIPLRDIRSVSVFQLQLNLNGSISISLSNGLKKNVELIRLMLLELIGANIS